MLWNIAMVLVSIVAIIVAVEINVFVGVFTWSVLTLFLLLIRPQ